MVIDDIEDDLDASGVQRLDHRLEFADASGVGVAQFRGEEADAVVAPVVAQALLQQVAVVDERVDGHQLECRDSQPRQVFDHGRGRKARISAAQMFWNSGLHQRQPANVSFVDHRVVPRNAWRTVVTPRERGIDHTALRRARGAVTLVEGQIFASAPEAVAEMRVAPVQGALQMLRVRLDEQFVGIEAVALGRIVGAMHAVTVERAGSCFGQIDMPDLIRALADVDALQLVFAARIEDAQFDLGGVRRE